MQDILYQKRGDINNINIYDVGVRTFIYNGIIYNTYV